MNEIENQTPLYQLCEEENRLYIKRDDFFPFSFGGNKARKGMLFWRDIKAKKADYIVTYGSGSSNHARIIANMAAAEKIPCLVITPEEVSEETYNSKMIELFGGKIITCPVQKVHETIETVMAELEEKGYHPYFIMGGGHGNLGTEAYVNCYDEICNYEKKTGIYFDYIFHASGTGTTQAGLICGQLMRGDYRKIIGISIARKNPYGRKVILNSVQEYLGNQYDAKSAEENTIFLDEYAGEGYGKENQEIQKVIVDNLCKYGIPMDTTYTGKAFWGMQEYLKEHNIRDKNILFLHTGGTPLFFDFLKGANYEYFNTKCRNEK